MVYVQGQVTLDDVEEALYVDRQYKPALALFSRADIRPPSRELLEYVNKLSLPYHAVDLSRCAIDRRKLLEDLLRITGRIRVFTKPIHLKTYVEKPVVVKAGSTVRDVAEQIHSSLLKTFKYAVVWRRELFPNRPTRVGLDYVLRDNDVIEIHA